MRVSVVNLTPRIFRSKGLELKKGIPVGDGVTALIPHGNAEFEVIGDVTGGDGHITFICDEPSTDSFDFRFTINAWGKPECNVTSSSHLRADLTAHGANQVLTIEDFPEQIERDNLGRPLRVLGSAGMALGESGIVQPGERALEVRTNLVATQRFENPLVHINGVITTTISATTTTTVCANLFTRVTEEGTTTATIIPCTPMQAIINATICGEVTVPVTSTALVVPCEGEFSQTVLQESPNQTRTTSLVPVRILIQPVTTHIEAVLTSTVSAIMTTTVTTSPTQTVSVSDTITTTVSVPVATTVTGLPTHITIGGADEVPPPAQEGPPGYFRFEPLPKLAQYSRMCQRAKCRKCGKVTWSGCGEHIEEVMRGVPESRKCTCAEHDPEPCIIM
ncbi:hypothetical protein PAPYR_2182 [Paratrimastix pyriformis]|uniref:Uncharacterized protein n=1 Tax=Paratrimastix pyriformis TaxID=342808 RepID=A0ABQ8UTC1_9EUKA|nr:hypothetical protein PAPYR_2182 [Paratrimastix pyriformis]